MGAAVRDLLGQAGTLLFQSLPGRSPGGGSDPGSLSAGTAEPGPLSTALQSGSAKPGCLPLHGISTATSSAGWQRRSSCSAPFSWKRTVLNRISHWTRWKPPVCWLCSPRKSGRLFTLRYTAGYNASEIGQLLCLPPGTVRSRLAQIRHRLKTELTED